MLFPCPACRCAVEASLEGRLLRCRSCAATIRSQPVEGGGERLAYDVEIAGRPETRQRIEVPWDTAQERRLAAWLLWSSLVALGLVGALYALARWLA